jgi:RNA polymerase-binding transcription factor DksA
MDETTIRRRLQTKIADILRRNEKVEGSRRRTRTPLGGDWKDDAIVRENDDVLEALDVEGRAMVEQLRAALLRLDEGVYGCCERCEEPIAPARLEALPEVTTCIACASVADTHARR